MGVVRKVMTERARGYIRAVAVRQSWGVVTALLGPDQLTSTVRSCRPCCEPEIADNVKFWSELVPVPS